MCRTGNSWEPKSKGPRSFPRRALRVLAVSSAGICGISPLAVVHAQSMSSSLRDSTASSRTASSAVVLVTSDAVDRKRLSQLSRGVGLGESLLLRSASSLSPSLDAGRSGWRGEGITPQFLVVTNSAIPFSQNYGALWAGVGFSSRTLVGFRLESDRVRLTVAPELIASSNTDWQLRRPGFYAPPVPPARSGGGYVFPYYIGPFSIDQPMRFGSHPIGRLDPGESTLMITGNRLQAGISNENEWWGPAIRNAIVMSNNAPGFPHLFFRSARPLQTGIGGVEFRWLVGGLTESHYFDTVSTNNVRSLASFAASLQTRWDPNLSFGLARSVYATATGWGQVPGRWFDVLANTHRPNNRPLGDSSLTPGGKDQLYSLFARWVLPSDGVELYTEWARTELPVNLRDFLVAPNHTQGYTLGMQWSGAAWRGGGLRFQFEVTQLEQSATFRDEPVGSWYTSRRVIQGYTNRGEIIGASIGPGASSQWLGLDYLKPDWRVGAIAGRIRWNEDVHSTANFPIYVAYCNHDVSIYPGVRAARTGALGSVSADLTLQNRINAFFQNGGGCPNNGPRVDIRNTTLSVTIATFSSRR